MTIRSFAPRQWFGANLYVLQAGSQTLAVDPSVPVEEFVRDAGWDALPPIDAILLTHAHFDHILALADWVRASGAPVFAGTADVNALADPRQNASAAFCAHPLVYTGEIRALADAQVLPFFDGVRVISVPGHTPGSVCYLLGTALFSGDLLFAGGGTGRCDLPGGDRCALLDSVSKILKLPDETRVYPGHGPSFLLHEYKENFT